MVEQLELLGDASTDGLSVSYIHTHPQVDVSLNALGYGGFGKADAGVPGVRTYVLRVLGRTSIEPLNERERK